MRSALALDKPVLGIHHLEGHLLSPLLVGEPPPSFRSSRCWCRAATRS